MPRELYCVWGRNWVRADPLHFRPLLQIQHSGKPERHRSGLTIAQEVAKRHDAAISASGGEDGTVLRSGLRNL